jgi:hypothetical protein
MARIGAIQNGEGKPASPSPDYSVGWIFASRRWHEQ